MRNIPWIVFRAIISRLQYPLMVVLAVVFFIGLKGGLGFSQVGIPFLFWHDELATRWAAGFALGVLIGEWWFISFLLDTRRIDWRELEQQSDERRSWVKEMLDPAWLSRTGNPPSLWRYLVPCTLVSAAAFCTLPFLTFQGLGVAFSTTGQAWLSVAAIFVGGFVYLASCWVAGWIARWRKLTEQRAWVGNSIEECRDPYDHPLAWAHLASAGLAVFFLLIFVVCFFCFWFSGLDHALIQFVSPAVVICVLLILLIRVYGFVQFHLHSWYFIGVVVVGLFLLGLNWWYWGNSSYRYVVPGLDYDHPIKLSEAFDPPANDSQSPSLIDDREALQKWAQIAPKTPQGKPILVVVATNGGGIRSQVWTTTMLAALEKRISGFPLHVRLISGASGGMVGATYYVATLAQSQSRAVHKIGDTVLSAGTMVRSMSRDALTPVTRTLLLHDLPATFKPPLWFPRIRDRGNALEQTWVENTSQLGPSPFARKLSELADGESSGWLPSLVYSPTLVEDGRRLIISNLELGHLIRTKVGSLSDPGDPFSVSGLQLRKSFPPYDLQLSTAARLSASFPYVCPNPQLPTVPRLSVIDAGLFDNYGLYLTTKWLQHHREFIKENTSGVLLLQLMSSPIARRPGGSQEETSALTNSITAPLRAVFPQIFQRVVYTADQRLESLHAYFNSDRNDFFTTVSLQYDGKASLSWYLTNAEVYTLLDPVYDPSGSGWLSKQDFESEQEFLERISAAAVGQNLTEDPQGALRSQRESVRQAIDALHSWWKSRGL